MKILLNLLPEEKREAIHRRLYSRFLVWQLFLLFLLQIYYVAMLLGIFIILDAQLKELQTIEDQEAASASQQKAVRDIERKFRSTNEAVQVVGAMAYKHIHFSNVLTRLDRLIPPGLAIYRLDTKDYTVMLSGNAAERSQLLAFDERLKADECIENVNVPISNLFSQRNVDFQIDFSLKPECLLEIKP